MATKRKGKTAANNGNGDETKTEKTPASQSEVVLHNVSKEHYLTFDAGNGQIAVVPVQLRDAKYVDENFTAVES